VRRTLKLAFAVTLFTALFLFPFLYVNAETSTIFTLENTWQTMASMPTARQGLGAAVVDGKIYAIGGGTESNEMYDPASDTWTTKTSMPKTKANFGIAVYEDKIYCIGGVDEAKDYGAYSSGVNFVYDTKTDSWSSIAALPTPVWDISANVVDGKIYVMGGQINKYTPGMYTTNITQIYDIAKDNWSNGAPLPIVTQSYVSTILGGKIYIIGGFNPNLIGDRSNAKNIMQIYDPVNDSWTIIPGAWNAGASGVLTAGLHAPQKLYQIGGTDGIFFKNWNKVYDPSSDSWSEGAAMPTARGWLGVAVVNDIIYAIGGKGVDINPTPPLATVERYIPFGYSETPLETPTPSPTATSNDYQSDNPTGTPTGGSSGDVQSALSTTAIIAGAVVAGTVIAVTGVTVYHFKHVPVKAAKGN
jgi:N-acetylneuraminic acid mutarotase